MMRPTAANTSVRAPAVAGLFYPDQPQQLHAAVSDYLRQAGRATSDPPKALIVPHAGYVYSGGVAAAGYACAASLRDQIRRIVLIGPSHRVYLQGAAVPSAQAFATPLGEIPVDVELRETLAARGDVLCSDEPHALEHSLEVQLPFLQAAFARFSILPIVVGAASREYVASVLEDVWGGPETLILASSDLSHYHPYARAQALDAATSSCIVRRETQLTGDQACGAAALNGLLQLAQRRGLEVREVARCNSGDTAGDRNRVVGYGAFALHERSGGEGRGRPS